MHIWLQEAAYLYSPKVPFVGGVISNNFKSLLPDYNAFLLVFLVRLTGGFRETLFFLVSM